MAGLGLACRIKRKSCNKVKSVANTQSVQDNPLKAGPVPFIADSLAKLAQWRAEQAPWICAGDYSDPASGAKRLPLVAFVPTMGALHDGHLELVRRAKAEGQAVIVSIFVNPYQFGPSEDFAKYPRTFERDLELLQTVGVDCVFYPSEAEMYPRGRDSIMAVVPPSPLNDTLEGAFRPTFFRGVATVVTKLFTLVQPHVSFFGEKDFQQLLVIKALVRDLNLPVKIVGVPTVREQDGLAMSSRNAYLDAAGRVTAVTLYKALSSVVDHTSKGAGIDETLAHGRKMIQAAGFELQYLEVRHAETLEPVTNSDFDAGNFVVLVAAKLGEVRLIDNIVVRPK